jgi:hypothetical protein
MTRLNARRIVSVLPNPQRAAIASRDVALFLEQLASGSEIEWVVIQLDGWINDHNGFALRAKECVI